MASGRRESLWGELRALLHNTQAPAFGEVWAMLCALGEEDREAALDYVRHHLKEVAPDVTAHLERFDEELLCDWSRHLVWWRLLDWAEWFEQGEQEELRALLLADVALLDHVASGFIASGALELRRSELETDLPYHQLDGNGFWVQQLVYAALEPEAVERVRALHRLCVRWEAMPAASKSLREGVSRGVARLREEGALPSLLGGGRGITQFFGAGAGLVRGVADTLGAMKQGVDEEQERAILQIERWFVAYALDWFEERL